MNALNWFEIPAADFERAARFYEALLNISLRREIFAGSMPNAVFPYADGVGGAVAQVPYAQPGAEGAVVYLAVTGEQALDAALERLSELGGALVMAKTNFGPMGFVALIRDTEGNRVGLHAPVAR